MTFQFATPWLLVLLVFVPLLGYLLNRKQGGIRLPGPFCQPEPGPLHPHLAFSAAPPTQPCTAAGDDADHFGLARPQLAKLKRWFVARG